MGIKQWFGDSLVSLIQDAQNKRAYPPPEARVATDMERMFGNVSPAVVAFKIANGYVVRTIDTQSDMVGMRQGGFYFCRDHQQIAEHIIASEAKRKLGVHDEEYLSEHLAAERARGVAMQGGFAQSKRATNRI
jgi:hypothetical protein